MGTLQISNLNSVRQAIGGGLFVTRATISRDDGNRRMFGQPRGHCRGLAIGQDVDDSPPLQIANDRTLAMTPLPGPVVVSDHPRFRGRLGGMSSDDAQQGILNSLAAANAARSSGLAGRPMRGRDGEPILPTATSAARKVELTPLPGAQRKSAAGIPSRDIETCAPGS